MGALKKKGHNVGVWFQDVHHQEDRFINEILANGFFDVVGIGFVAGYYPYRKINQLANLINSHEKRDNIHFVLGGHGPAGAPEFFLERTGADAVVVGDGESAICEIADGNMQSIIQSKPEFSDYPDLSCYESFPMDVYRLNRTPLATRTDFCIPILSSRGCKWNCSFCYRMRDGFHERSTTAIMKEIIYLHNTFHINYFDFEDELLMSSETRTGEICESILELPFKIKWDCNGRLNFAKKPILSLMKKAGCGYVNFGIESLNQKILNQMGKGLTLDMVFHGIESTIEAGLIPGLNLLWGFPDNTEQDLWEEVDFLKQYDQCHELRTIRPVTAYPGCKLFDEAKKEGLIKNAEDFYENRHQNSDLISINFTKYNNQEAHEMLYAANKELMINYFDKRLEANVEIAEELYINSNADFRGWRTV
jgi:radical SAM superfamily enzyme YgiQ (UPF0313 family)